MPPDGRQPLEPAEAPLRTGLITASQPHAPIIGLSTVRSRSVALLHLTFGANHRQATQANCIYNLINSCVAVSVRREYD